MSNSHRGSADTEPWPWLGNKEKEAHVRRRENIREAWELRFFWNWRTQYSKWRCFPLDDVVSMWHRKVQSGNIIGICRVYCLLFWKDSRTQNISDTWTLSWECWRRSIQSSSLSAPGSTARVTLSMGTSSKARCVERTLCFPVTTSKVISHYAEDHDPCVFE